MNNKMVIASKLNVLSKKLARLKKDISDMEVLIQSLEKELRNPEDESEVKVYNSISSSQRERVRVYSITLAESMYKSAVRNNYDRDKIIEELGISKPTFYRHLKTLLELHPEITPYIRERGIVGFDGERPKIYEAVRKAIREAEKEK